MTEAPLPMAGSIFQHEPIEFQKCELSPVIAVAQAPLKDKELLQIVGQGTVEARHHFGTGSVTPRRRRSDTRTYTEVEEGRR